MPPTAVKIGSTDSELPPVPSMPINDNAVIMVGYNVSHVELHVIHY